MSFDKKLRELHALSTIEAEDKVLFCSYAGGVLGIKTGLIYSWYRGGVGVDFPDECIQQDMIDNIQLCLERDDYIRESKQYAAMARSPLIKKIKKAIQDAVQEQYTCQQLEK